MALEPLSFPVALLALVHAWMIPALYAARGANVLRPRRRSDDGARADGARAAGRSRRPRRRARCTRARASCPSAATLGVWLVGEAGALLVRPGGRRVDCWCVKADAADLPVRRPHRPPAARPARGRAGLRHRGEPGLQRRALARPAPPRAGDAPGARRRRGARALSSAPSARPASRRLRAPRGGASRDQPTPASATHRTGFSSNRPHVGPGGMRMGPAVHTRSGREAASCSP